MLTYNEALEKIISTIKRLPPEQVALSEIDGRYLAEDLIAQFELPRFDNSAVDGFGVKIEDLKSASEGNPITLSLAGTVHAGDSNSGTASRKDFSLRAGETIKILTGAPVHPSVDAVVMREFCVEDSEKISFCRTPEIGENIRRQGEELRAGDRILRCGQKATPPVVALLASFGHEHFSVSKQPSVAIITTGDELVKPGEPLGEGKIYESNSFGLSSCAKAMNLKKVWCLHARDTREETSKTFQEAYDRADIVISAGGVSMGEKDLVKSVLEEDLGVTGVFWKIAIKPGKPVYFGYRDDSKRPATRKLFFGLPGNPVSALVTFHLFVRPALIEMQGGPITKPDDARWNATVRANLRKKPGRLDFVRGILECSETGALNALPTSGQGSHMLSGLALADCLIEFPAEASSLSAGDLAIVDKLNWSE